MDAPAAKAVLVMEMDMEASWDAGVVIGVWLASKVLQDASMQSDNIKNVLFIAVLVGFGRTGEKELLEGSYLWQGMIASQKHDARFRSTTLLGENYRAFAKWIKRSTSS